MQLKRLSVCDLLLGTVEARNRSAVVVRTNAFVAYSKLALPKLRVMLDSA